MVLHNAAVIAVVNSSSNSSSKVLVRYTDADKISRTMANLPSTLEHNNQAVYHGELDTYYKTVYDYRQNRGFGDEKFANEYRLDAKSHDAIIDVFRSIREITTKAISQIEDSGGYTITSEPNANYAIKNGVLSWQPHAKKTGYFNYKDIFPKAYNKDNFNFRLYGTWWSKEVKVTRQDGLDVIFIPIK